MNATFHPFIDDVEHIVLPEKFTFPFNYEPHILSEIAVSQLCTYIQDQVCKEVNFGLNDENGHGKMFGVLVVKNAENELGFLAAFSGKLKDRNHWRGFVPPVYDMLKADGYYRNGENEIIDITRSIELLENSDNLKNLQNLLENRSREINRILENEKDKIKINKERRKTIRSSTTCISLELSLLLEKESIQEHYAFRRLKMSFRRELEEIQKKISNLQDIVEGLKIERKRKSNELQFKLFDSYIFLNAHGESKSLPKIFGMHTDVIPPSGSGECCAPKLLQYAFLNDMNPIALAEFWYGKSPSSEIRKHMNYYPSCRSKCFPILSYMMEGLDVDENRMMIRLSQDKYLQILYQDQDILVLNKPIDFLSVPGKEIEDSVYRRVKEMYPLAEGPLIVHRLDMSTSGIVVVALSKKSHYHLQRQFETRTIYKKYVALLDGVLGQKEGTIVLPLRVDIHDRPRQLVDFEYGKQAITRYKIIRVYDGLTRVEFFPFTGRTHQLRVHAAHTLGLGVPILGDDLYGKRADRLYLHAEELIFMHPTFNHEMHITCKADF